MIKRLLIASYVVFSNTPNPPCICGSTTHRRINHRDCPLNPNRQRLDAANIPNTESNTQNAATNIPQVVPEGNLIANQNYMIKRLLIAFYLF